MARALIVEVERKPHTKLKVWIAPQSLLGPALAAGVGLGFVAYSAGTAAAAIAFITLAGAAMPLIYSNGVLYDGKRLRQTGLLNRLLFKLFGARHYLRIRDIDRIETRTHRLYRFRDRVYFRYLTEIAAGDQRFSVTSFSRSYPEFIRTLAAAVPDGIMDVRTMEVRDFLSDVNEARRSAAAAGIPDSEVLEDSLRSTLANGFRVSGSGASSKSQALRAAELVGLGNQLRSVGLSTLR